MKAENFKTADDVFKLLNTLSKSQVFEVYYNGSLVCYRAHLYDLDDEGKEVMKKYEYAKFEGSDIPRRIEMLKAQNRIGRLERRAVNFTKDGKPFTLEGTPDETSIDTCAINIKSAKQAEKVFNAGCVVLENT